MEKKNKTFFPGYKSYTVLIIFRNPSTGKYILKKEENTRDSVSHR